MPRQLITKDELFKRYQQFKTLSVKEKAKMRSKLYCPAKRYYGTWKNFLEAMESEPIKSESKSKDRPKTDRIKQLAAVIKMAHDTGRKVEVLKCVEAVRRGDADCLRII